MLFKLSHYSKRKGMTMNLFYKANLEKETTNKENYRLISLISIYVNILNKIRANQMLLMSSQKSTFLIPSLSCLRTNTCRWSNEIVMCMISFNQNIFGVQSFVAQINISLLFNLMSRVSLYVQSIAYLLKFSYYLLNNSVGVRLF